MVLWLRKMAWLLLGPLSDRILASLVERYSEMSHIIANILPYLNDSRYPLNALIFFVIFKKELPILKSFLWKMYIPLMLTMST